MYEYDPTSEVTEADELYRLLSQHRLDKATTQKERYEIKKKMREEFFMMEEMKKIAEFYNDK